MSPGAQKMEHGCLQPLSPDPIPCPAVWSRGPKFRTTPVWELGSFCRAGASAVAQPAALLALPQNSIAGLAENSPKLILSLAVLYFSGLWGGWWGGQGWDLVCAGMCAHGCLHRH